MKYWLCLGLSLSTLSACQESKDTKPAHAPTAADTSPAQPNVEAKAVPVEAAAVEAPSAEPAFSVEPEADKYPDAVLEGYPGFTPSLPLVRFPATPYGEGLAGKPGESPAMGASEPLVRIVIFSDFQCTVCRRIVEPLKKVVRAFPNDVQVVFKHLPLSSHRYAEPAARASLAAFKLGRFWDYHDRLFERQRGLNDADLVLHAQTIGLDMQAFTQAFAEEAIKQQVTYEAAMAQALDVSNTPAFFINGENAIGWASYSALEWGVKQQIEQATALLQQGVARKDIPKALTKAKNLKLATLLYGE